VPRVLFRGARYGVREQAMISSLVVWCGMGHQEAKEFAARALTGERVSVQMEDADAAYSLAGEMIDLGVNAEADEGDY
jgi:hypothetical protein